MIRKTAYIAVFCGMALALIVAGALHASPIQAAQLSGSQDNAPTILQADAQTGESIELTCQYPVLSSYAGISYSFDINIQYKGSGFKVFDLKATVPQGFNYTIAPGYSTDGREIAAVRLDGTKSYSDSIKLSMTPYAWKVPAPGSYPITLTASSGDIKTSIQLTAVVTVNYDLKLSTPDGRLNTEATAGQDNPFTVVVSNGGTGDLQNVTVSNFAKDRPNTWTVTAKPEKIDLLKAGESKEVQLTIRPSEKTIAGDYSIGIQAEPESRYAFGSLQIRVTVLTPTVWGWVGVGIVVLVIVALAFIFIRFGRR